MRIKAAIVTALISSALFFTSLTAGSSNISGTKCAKLGLTKIVSNAKFTCVKAGKNLVWNKGVALTPAPKKSTPPTPTVPPTPTPSQTVPETANPSASSTPTSPKLNPKYPKAGDFCKYDKLLAFRHSLVPGYTKVGELRWLTCNGNSEYVLGLDEKVDEETDTPIIPSAVIHASDLKSYDDVSRKSQDFVNNLQIGPHKNLVTLKYFIEPGDYGDYLDILKSDLDGVMAYYDTIGITKFMLPLLKVVVGHTNAGIDSILKSNCLKAGYVSPGSTGATFCDDGSGGVLIINVAANVIGSMIYDQNANFAKTTKSREMLLYFRWAVIHELYHHFQSGSWSKNNLGTHDPLPWIVEGSAQAVPFYYLAKSLNTSNSYQYLWEVVNLTNLVPPGQGPENGPSGCVNPAKEMAWGTEDARRQCQYTQGMLITETFIARYGMDKWVQLVSTLSGSNINQFSSFFTSITNDNLDDFYKAADVHSRNMGYQIK